MMRTMILLLITVRVGMAVVGGTSSVDCSFRMEDTGMVVVVNGEHVWLLTEERTIPMKERS